MTEVGREQLTQQQVQRLVPVRNGIRSDPVAIDASEYREENPTSNCQKGQCCRSKDTSTPSS